MTLRWLPLDALEAHPENSNRMSDGLREKLKGHIRRTGLYEPLVVRPIKPSGSPPVNTRGADGPGCIHPGRNVKVYIHYQIINGHHRARVLRELGHTHARCDVWEVDDDEARLLLATLNRLEGRDDPSARARLVAHLAEGRSPEDLARLLPEPADAVERLLVLAKPPPAALDPAAIEPPARPMTFFLSAEQYALVADALRDIGQAGLSRAERLERLAAWYLESKGRQ